MKLLTQRTQFFLLTYVQTLKQIGYYQHTEWLLFEKHREWMDTPIKQINTCMNIPSPTERLPPQSFLYNSLQKIKHPLEKNRNKNNLYGDISSIDINSAA